MTDDKTKNIIGLIDGDQIPNALKLLAEKIEFAKTEALCELRKELVSLLLEAAGMFAGKRMPGKNAAVEWWRKVEANIYDELVGKDDENAQAFHDKYLKESE